MISSQRRLPAVRLTVWMVSRMYLKYEHSHMVHILEFQKYIWVQIFVEFGHPLEIYDIRPPWVFLRFLFYHEDCFHEKLMKILFHWYL